MLGNERPILQAQLHLVRSESRSDIENRMVYQVGEKLVSPVSCYQEPQQFETGHRAEKVPALMTAVDPDTRFVSTLSKIAIGDHGNQERSTGFRFSDGEGPDQMRSCRTHSLQIVSHGFEIEVVLDV